MWRLGPISANENGVCWMKLFSNIHLAQGCPVPRRRDVDANTGIEMSLHLMAKLLNTNRISNFKGIFLIKGVSAILVPTRRQEGLTFWHLVSNDDGSYISYSDVRIGQVIRDYPRGLSVGDLEASRHIVGWCAEAMNCAGE